MSNDENLEMLNSNGNNKNLTKLREEFKVKYVKEKGWDLTELSEEQITEIKSQKGYQAPGMICG